MPQLQFDGTIDGSVGGVVPDFFLGGSVQNAGSYQLITNTAPNQNILIAVANKITPGSVGGLTSYLGGHKYTLNTIDQMNARRFYMNSLFVPARRPLSCL